MKIALLDDYEDAALHLADCTRVAARTKITVFPDTIDAATALRGAENTGQLATEVTAPSA